MDKKFKERRQQYLRGWLLKQPYLFLDGKYDGMTAWELSGIILKQIDEFVSFNSPDYYDGIETTESKVAVELLNEPK